MQFFTDIWNSLSAHVQTSSAKKGMSETDKTKKQPLARNLYIHALNENDAQGLFESDM